MTKEIIQNETDWKKKCLLISMFHNSKLIEHGQERNKGWTLSKTAEALGLSIGYISEELQLAIKMPQLEKCETREEALKKWRKIR